MRERNYSFKKTRKQKEGNPMKILDRKTIREVEEGERERQRGEICKLIKRKVDSTPCLTRYIKEIALNSHELRRPPVNIQHHQPLSMKRRPANDECDSHRHFR